MSIFSEYRDYLLETIEERVNDDLTFPLPKLNNALNGYNPGEFIIVGGRKTSGKGYFILNNYVVNPLIQRILVKKEGTDVNVKVIYISTKFSLKHTIDRMAINYISQQSGGNKVSIPSVYGFKGKHGKIDPDTAKSIYSNALTVFDTLVEKGIFSIFTGKKSITEIESFIHNVMEELGEYDSAGDFEYNEKHKKTKVIIAIDDTLNINKDIGSTSTYEFATRIASSLRTMAKSLNATVVLGVAVPSHYKKEKVHRSSTADISPYHMYCDRSIVLHNPVETDDFKFLGYDVEDFINESTGACYFRSAFIATNSMGASGTYIPLFLLPENGYFEEMPSSNDEFGLNNIMDKI